MASTAQPQFIANRYEIRDIVGRGGMGVVYRCYDHVARSEIALKQMLVSLSSSDNESPPITATKPLSALDDIGHGDTISVATSDTWRRDSPFVGMMQTDDSENSGTFRLALSHEFETLAHLRHPNIVTVLDYGFDVHKMPFFTMPLLNAPLSITDAAETATLDTKLTWLAEMLQALSYLHHHKIIHRDLKPDNALLTSNQIKLLDFGLAVIREKTDSMTGEDNDDMISGTIPYMAPELIQGGVPSTRSDLYAFGMIAFELIAGYYPFEFNGVGELIMKLVTETPDVSDLDVAEPIQAWVEKLVHLDQNQRADDALTALKELASITDTRIPIETKTIQESYLQTARFVGRDAELKVLVSGLQDTLKGGGKSFLVVGDDGVGKTRLLNELRILALVNGYRVLQGYGTQGSMIPHQILREPVKRLLLSTPISATEANILKILLPDLEDILGRTVPEVVQDEVSQYASQLSSVILKLFKEQTEPTLLILDDVHLGSESIEILSNLIATISDSRLMIVASQRSDTTLDIAGQLKETDVVHLERLSDASVATLARSILGDVGLRADVQEVLKREAQGNVNFLLEVIRALLEEVQHLRDIAMMRLPKEITAGGINRVLAQRLNKISDKNRQLFDLIAAAGLTIDIKLLQHLAEALGVSDEDWLTLLTNHAIIEREGEEWQITHERLRLVALEQVAADDLVQLNTTVAEALEYLYPDSVQKAGMIAHHWNLAGNDERERPYLLDAADYALRLNSFQDAVGLYRRALELRDDAASDERMAAQLQIRLGESLMYIGEYDEALERLEAGLKAFDAEDKNERAKTLSLLSDAYWRAGQFDAAQHNAEQALQLAREITAVEVEVRSLSRLGMIATDKGDYNQAEAYYEQGLTLSNDHNDVVGKTMLNNNYGILAGTRGDLDAAKDRFAASLALSESNDWGYRAVPTLINLGSISGMQGDLDNALSYFERSLVMSRAIGDRRHVSISLDNLGFLAQLREDYQQALQYFEESLILAETIGNRAAVPVVLRKLALVFEKLDKLDMTSTYLRQAIEKANEIQAAPTALHALADLARITYDSHLAVQWAQYVVSHEATRQDAQDIAQAVLDKWQGKLNTDDYQSAIDAAKNVSLDTSFDKEL
ncbi:MAG: tetratricopeptide repeat protein [Phototrophicaceae bacterium]